MPVLPVDPGKIKALIFDVDGTLYRQGPVRRAMLWRLLRECFYHPTQGLATLEILAAYRRAQEKLRKEIAPADDIATAQLRIACQWTRADFRMVRSVVNRWMEREPLTVLQNCLAQGVVELLEWAKNRGLRLAALSDYPVDEKLAALGVAKFFDVALSAQDRQIQRFKPDPRGLIVAMQRLSVSEKEVLYVGDRFDVDADAAANAGVGCVIIGAKRFIRRRKDYLPLPSCRELRDAISNQSNAA